MLTGKIYVRNGVFLVPSGPVVGFKIKLLNRSRNDEVYSIIVASPSAFPPLDFHVEYDADVVEGTKLKREKDVLQDNNYTILKLHVKTK